jgi:hypothetical protein
MNQAANMVISERGDYENWVKDCGGSSAATCTADEALEWFNDTIGRHLNKVETVISDDGSGFYVYFADGSILYVPAFIYDTKFYLDSKALANPKDGINAFLFRFNPILLPNFVTVPDNVKYHIDRGFEPYAYRWNGTREGFFNSGHAYSCSNTGTALCAKLIQYEGWSIPDDYPLKF